MTSQLLPNIQRGNLFWYENKYRKSWKSVQFAYIGILVFMEWKINKITASV
jgi:hypothetical protein